MIIYGKMEISNINKKKIESLLKKGKRIDNRDFFDYRDIVIETNISKKAEGSARVKLGNTEVIVGVKLGTQEPYPDHDDEGTLMTGMEFNPICGERYEAGPPKIDAIEAARVVDRGIRESGFIDFKKLCIKKGEKVWSVALDIYCINDDGDVIDASSLASVVALSLTKLPHYDEKTETIDYENKKQDLPLTENIPLTITFYKINDNFIIDPNREEEDTSNARVTFTISCPKKEKIINAMQKGDEESIKIEELNKIAEESEKIYDKIFPKVEKEIKKLEKSKA